MLNIPLIRRKIRVRKEKESEEEVKVDVSTEIKVPKITERIRRFSKFDTRVVKVYPLYEPWAYAVIVENIRTGEYVYNIDEISMNEDELNIYKRVIDYLIWRLEPLAPGADYKAYFMDKAKEAVRTFQIKLGRTPTVSWGKIMYYVERDIIGFGPIDPLMRDPAIEDISCNGPGKPLYVWHREFESIPTNLVFKKGEEIDELILKLAHMAGKHISIAYPVLDAILPGGHRLAATFQKEVSTSGSTFTIRKFREDPITIIDMILYGTVSPELAAYFWLTMDYKAVTLVLGVTGSGKTSTLNALLNLTRPYYKIVTIEDTPELRLPHENWVQLVSRPSYSVTGTTGEISLFHLVKLSLRYRPDIIVVGEVRGEEAYVLFQAIATGHGGCTTIHAENIDAAIKRLTSPPMNIPPGYIPLINVGMVIKRVHIMTREGKFRPARRITNIWEIEDYDKYVEIGRWDPVKDKFELNLSKSNFIKLISEQTGRSISELIEEIGRRRSVLQWLAIKNIRNYKDVAKYIQLYYTNPQQVLHQIKEEVTRYAKEVKTQEG